MFSNQQIRENPNTVRKLLDSWRQYAESLEKENKKYKEILETLDVNLENI